MMAGAQDLLNELWGDTKDLVCQITSIKNGVAKNFSVVSIEAAIEKAVELDKQGHDVYHACAIYKTGDSRTAANTIGAFGFWFDIDCGLDKASKGKGYETKKKASQALGEFLTSTSLPAPTHIVDSGNGLHVYFICESLIPQTEWQKSARQLKALCKHLSFLADESRTSDIASILRFVGTHNRKDSVKCKPVKLLHSSLETLNAESFIRSIEEAHQAISIEFDQTIANTFPIEQLGVKNHSKPYEHSDENRLELLEVSRAAYPHGISSYTEFELLGLSLASLVVVDEWPEPIALDILDDICSKPANANRDNNNQLWNGFIVTTREKHQRGERITGVGSIFYQAKENGWKRESKNADMINIDDFALIKIGSKVGIVDLQQAEKASTSNPLCVYSTSDGKLLLKRKITERSPSANAEKIMNQWLLAPSTKSYDGVEFNPTNIDTGRLNLWRGLSVKPKVGDCKLITSFIKDIICSGSNHHFEYLLGWLAHMVQKPHEKPGVSVTLLGGQGIGKGMFAAKLVGALYKDHFLHLQSDRTLTGDFNDSLESSYVVFADEAFFSGDRKSANILKAIETESRIHINPKYQPSRQIESFHRIISASNNDHAAYVETDDRRKFVLRVSENKKNDRAYWISLADEINNGGLEAFAYELMQTNISGFQVRDKPDTGELLKQKLASLDSIPQWWADRLMEGTQISTRTTWDDWVPTSQLHQDFSSTARANSSRGRIPSIREFIERLRALCPDIEASQQGPSNSRKRGFTFPDLTRARELFEAKLGGKLSW
jgi:hypothetical protein